MALGHCAGLYGRDDVFQALKVQSCVLTRIRAGWRPMTAQRRGAEAPLAEPPLPRKLCPVHANEFDYNFRTDFVPALSQKELRVGLRSSDKDESGGLNQGMLVHGSYLLGVGSPCVLW